MALEISNWFVQQFKDNVEHLVQQEGSKLRNLVSVSTDLKGYKAHYDQIGSVEAQRITTRHGDTPIMGTPHHRRELQAHASEWGDLIDDVDRVQMLVNPRDDYAVAGGYALGREFDKQIVEAYNATVNVGQEGTKTKSFPSAQVVPTDLDGDGTNENLTLDKLRAAKKLFTNNNVNTDNPMNKLYIVCTGDEIENLLGIQEVQSSDYNTVRALVDGEINTYMGFQFVTLDPGILTKDSNGIRSIYVWAQSGMKLAIDPDREVSIYQRGDKRNATQVYMWQRSGAVRMQEEKVVEIKVDTTK